jgi:hypothetical protein
LIDFVLYGERGLCALEVKRSFRLRDGDLDALRMFRDDYPMARPFVLYGGTRAYHDDGIEVLPVADALPRLTDLLQ